MVSVETVATEVSSLSMVRCVVDIVWDVEFSLYICSREAFAQAYVLSLLLLFAGRKMSLTQSCALTRSLWVCSPAYSFA